LRCRYSPIVYYLGLHAEKDFSLVIRCIFVHLYRLDRCKWD